MEPITEQSVFLEYLRLKGYVMHIVPNTRLVYAFIYVWSSNIDSCKINNASLCAHQELFLSIVIGGIVPG